MGGIITTSRYNTGKKKKSDDDRIGRQESHDDMGPIAPRSDVVNDMLKKISSPVQDGTFWRDEMTALLITLMKYKYPEEDEGKKEEEEESDSSTKKSDTKNIKEIKRLVLKDGSFFEKILDENGNVSLKKADEIEDTKNVTEALETGEGPSLETKVQHARNATRSDDTVEDMSPLGNFEYIRFLIYTYLRPNRITSSLLKGHRYYMRHPLGNLGYPVDHFEHDLLEVKFCEDGKTCKHRYWRDRISPAGRYREFANSHLKWRILRVSQPIDIDEVNVRRGSFFLSKKTYKSTAEEKRLKEIESSIQRAKSFPKEKEYHTMYWIELTHDPEHMKKILGERRYQRMYDKLEYPVKYAAGTAAIAAANALKTIDALLIEMSITLSKEADAKKCGNTSGAEVSDKDKKQEESKKKSTSEDDSKAPRASFDDPVNVFHFPAFLNLGLNERTFLKLIPIEPILCAGPESAKSEKEDGPSPPNGRVRTGPHVLPSVKQFCAIGIQRHTEGKDWIWMTRKTKGDKNYNRKWFFTVDSEPVSDESDESDEEEEEDDE